MAKRVRITAEIDFEPLTPFSPDERLVLFRDEVHASEGPPGAVPFELVFVLLSADNGVMDLSTDHVATARSSELVAFSAAEVAEAREKSVGDWKFSLPVGELVDDVSQLAE